MRHRRTNAHVARRKILGIVFSILIAVSAAIDFLVLFFKPTAETPLATSSASATAAESSSRSGSGTATSSDSASSSSSSTSSSSSSSSSSTSSSKYADGTYTGALVQTNRGDVQVRITVSGGKITNVTAITYPNETSQSQTISAQVIPTFQSEAVKSQNADIQLVSGATETYTGFKGSLQDAINQTMSGSSTSSTQGQS